MNEKNYNQFKKGSEWRKWDLHLHTPYTNLENNFKSDASNYILKIKDCGINVVALTNYFFFKEEEFELQKEFKKIGITAFLNLELRVSYTNNRNECCDLHIIFSDDVNKQEISDFLIKLNVNVSGSHKMAKYLKPEDLRKATVEFNDLLRILDDKSLGLKGRYFLGCLSRGQGNARSSSNSATLYQNCDFLIHSSDSAQNLAEDRAYWLERGRALFQSSDAHKLEDIGTKFTWIKADPTFEGLKQVMYEPEERIRLVGNKPDDKQGYQVIDSIVLNDEGLWSEEIEFNENLNTVIGGRSTGKSSLLAAIAMKLGKDNSDQYQFIKTVLPGVSIKWKDGETDIDRDIEFFPQNYMNMLASDYNERNKLVKNIIKNKDSNDVLGKYSQFIIEQKSAQQNLVSKILVLKDSVDAKKTELAELGDKSGVDGEIEKLTQELTKFQTKLTEEESKEYKNIIKNIDSYNNELDQSEKSINKLSHLRDFNFFSLSNDEYSQKLIGPIFGDTLSIKFIELKSTFEREWKEAVEHQKNVIIENQGSLKIKIDNCQSSDIYKKGQDDLSNNTAAQELTSKLIIEQNKLAQIREKTVEFEYLQKEFSSCIEKLAVSHQQLKEKATALSTDLCFEQSDLTITVNCTFNRQYIAQILEGQLNLTKNKEHIAFYIDNYDDDPIATVKKFIDLLIKKELFFKGSNTEQTLLNQILCVDTYKQDFVLTYQNDTFDTMSQGKQAFVILKLLLEFNEKKCPIIIDQPEDSLDNRAIYNELVHYIKKKKKERQIILVTHNANVVVSADAEQIIVANQHGTNAKNKNGKKFEYVTGSIEHSMSKIINIEEILYSQGVREHICEILEGGEDAFKKREQKYQLNG